MLNPRQSVLAGGLGTGILVAAVVGSGIAWNDVPAFFAAQILGALLALGIASLLSITSKEST